MAGMVPSTDPRFEQVTHLAGFGIQLIAHLHQILDQLLGCHVLTSC